MEDAWGYVEDDEYDDDYGADAGGYGGAAAQEHVDDGRSTEDFLGDAVRNLIETEELGEEGLAMLAEQREMLKNIKGNVDRMDNSLNEADRVISEMESPWALKGTRITKHSGNRSAVTDAFDDGPGGSFAMEGIVLKRGRTMKAWQSRYFKQVGDNVEYTQKKGDPPSKVRLTSVSSVFFVVVVPRCDYVLDSHKYTLPHHSHASPNTGWAGTWTACLHVRTGRPRSLNWRALSW